LRPSWGNINDFDGNAKIFRTGGYMYLSRIAICFALVFSISTQAMAVEKEYEKLYKQGVAANKKGNLDEAIRCYSKAIALKPDSSPLFYVRGRAYSQHGEYDKAINDFTRAVTLKPDYAEAYNHRGVNHIGKGEMQKAMADFNMACKLGSSNGCANVNKFKEGK
jgi:tetratricopeptide (TPR) repeat protein